MRQLVLLERAPVAKPGPSQVNLEGQNEDKNEENLRNFFFFKLWKFEEK